MVSARYRHTLLSSLLFSLLLVACQAHAELKVLDDTGREVRLTSPAKRIITLSPYATELVYSAGAANELIATVNFSDHPEAAQKLPRVGSASGIDRETILNLRPDLVVAWQSGNKPSDLDWLSRLNIPLYLSEPGDLNDLAMSIRKLGRLTGHDKEASINADIFERQITNSCQPDRIRTAYIHIWNKPRYTIGGKHWMNDVLDKAGYINVFADIDTGSVAISEEAWVSRDFEVQISDSSSPAIHPDPKIISLSADISRPTPRLTETVKNLCREAIH